MAPHSSTLTWKIPWMEEPGRLKSMGLLKVGHNFTFTFQFPTLEKEMATHSSIFAWRIPGMGEPSGLLSVGLHRVRHDWNDLATVAAAMDCRPPGSSAPWGSPGKNSGVGFHALLQGMFPYQGSNPHLCIGRQILYHWHHLESPLSISALKKNRA